MKKLFLLLILSGLLVFNTQASDNNSGRFIKEFNQQLGSAYSDYRMVLFQTNKKVQNASLKFGNQFFKKWQQIREKYEDAPPAVYALDPTWKLTIKKIKKIAQQGIQEIKQNELAEAHETLEAIRDLLGDLRKRNGAVIFSDHVNKYHEHMEAVLDTKLSGSISSSQLNALREKLAVLDFLMDELKHNAPVEYQSNAEFNKLLNGNFKVLEGLRTAIESGSVTEITKALKAVKPPYAKLFIKFG